MIRSEHRGQLSTEQASQSQTHTQWPCVQHPLDVSCDDAIEAYAARTAKTVIRSSEDVSAAAD